MPLTRAQRLAADPVGGPADGLVNQPDQPITGAARQRKSAKAKSRGGGGGVRGNLIRSLLTPNLDQGMCR